MRRLRLIIIITALLLFSSSVLTAQQKEFVVIVNNSVLENSINQSTLQKIFLGKKIQWDNGDAIVPVTLKEGDVHEAFLDEIVKKSPSAFSSFWISQLYTGKAVPPPSYENDEQVKQVVEQTRGAVGYISKEAMGKDSSEVKILEVLK